MNTFGCDEFREIAPDLALGLLAGNERGVAISHLATCARCRRHLDGLVQVADDLLLLSPSLEPEIGFESRVIERLAAGGAFSLSLPGGTPQGATTRTDVAPATASPAPTVSAGLANGPEVAGPTTARRWWNRPLTIAVAAALLVIVGATGVVTSLNRARTEGRASALNLEAHAANQLAARTAVVWADRGHSVCQLVAFPAQGSQAAHLIIHLEEPNAPPDSYQVFAVPTSGGRPIPIGTIEVVNGQGTLTAAIPPASGPVDAVRVMDGPANTKYWATFAAV